MPTPERRLITAEDLFRLRLVSDPQLSPDGEQVAFVVKRTDRERNRYCRVVMAPTGQTSIRLPESSE